MNYLLDTNVVSEAVKPRPNPGVLRWLEANDEDRLFLSAATLAELHGGVQRLPEGARKRRLRDWLAADLTERFRGRILPIDEPVAAAWGEILAEREAAGRPILTIDCFLAATARVHQLTLATRNLADFDPTVPAVNPWSGSAAP